MSSKIKTYNPKEVIVTCGTHIVTGYADDSFISIEPNGDGITKRPAVTAKLPVRFRRITPTRSSSPCCRPATATPYFSGMVDLDRDTGNGLFPILIKDLKGGLVFSTEGAWCVKKAPVTRGKETNNREWELTPAMPP